jgi:hypothetical protein
MAPTPRNANAHDDDFNFFGDEEEDMELDEELDALDAEDNVEFDPTKDDVDDDTPRTEFEEMVLLIPGNDNAGPKPKTGRLKPCPYTHERVSTLLALAGYDPERIPLEARLGALQVAWCFEKSLFDEREIARCVSRSLGQVRRMTDLLRHAAKQGTVVG